MGNTINDKLAKKLVPVMRTLQDLNQKILGKEVSLLRITVISEDMMGQTETALDTAITDNCIVQYPTGDIRMHVDTSGYLLDTESFSLWDILPITIFTPYETDKADGYNESLIAFKTGDIIVDVFLDEQGNKFPIIMEITNIIGSFRTRYLLKRKYEATLVRGTLGAEYQDVINTYVDNLVLE